VNYEDLNICSIEAWASGLELLSQSISTTVIALGLLIVGDLSDIRSRAAIQIARTQIWWQEVKQQAGHHRQRPKLQRHPPNLHRQRTLNLLLQHSRIRRPHRRRRQVNPPYADKPNKTSRMDCINLYNRVSTQYADTYRMVSTHYSTPHSKGWESISIREDRTIRIRVQAPQVGWAQ
jgi:hypothetical protein